MAGLGAEEAERSWLREGKDVSGLETAIRNALDRSDRTNPETRARIYQSARLALESGLRKQDVTDPAIVSQQRQRLESIIQAVEAEERFALGSTPGKVVPPVVTPAERFAAPARGEPAVQPEGFATLGTPEPVIASRNVAGADARPVDTRRDHREPPRFWGRSGASSTDEAGWTPGAEREGAVRPSQPVPDVVAPVETTDAASVDMLVDAPVDDTRDRPVDDPLAGLQSASVRSVDAAVEPQPAAPEPSVDPPPIAVERRETPQAPSPGAATVETAAAMQLGGRDGGERLALRSPASDNGKTAKKISAKERRAGKAERRAGRKKRSSLGSWLFSTFLVLATLGGGLAAAAWWLDQQGLLKPLLDPNSEMPVATTDNPNGAGAGLKTLGKREGFTADWLPVFQPTEAGEGYSGGSQATTEVVKDEAGPRLRIASRASGPDGEVAITVPAGALDDISGKTSTVALTVQGVDGQSTEFYVECDFASLGSCGRHRFTVHGEKVDMLFQVRFDRTLAPGTPGRLLINSDVSGQGESLNLYAIRLLPGT